MRVLRAGLAVMLYAGCAVDEIEDLAAVEQKSQCGPSWDVQDVEQYDGTLGVTTQFVARHEARVGHLLRGCSGTLISDDLFLSAGHCNYVVGDTVRFDFQEAPDGTLRTPRNFAVTEIVESENSGSYDYAIVRLAGAPGREYGHASIDPIDPVPGWLITVIGHPASVPKVVHTGYVHDHQGNWFRHQADTTGGSSGSGVLDLDGRLIGVHTNAGCSAGNPINGNWAMRMSKLVERSPTLAALARTKVIWRNTDTRLSIWSVDSTGALRTYAEHGPMAGWFPLSFSDNRVLLRHTDGRASYWVINDAGHIETYAENGPFAGWTPVAHANDRVLWRHHDGRASLWTVNDVGHYVSHREYGPFAGWTPIGYANNRLLWRHDNGRISLWRLDDAGNYLAWREYGPFVNWTAQAYYNGELFWRNADGRSSVWTLDRDMDHLTWAESGPHQDWTPVANADRRMLWAHPRGILSLWTTTSDGIRTSVVEHGPHPGWTPILTAAGAR